jgi:hypothetical protein
MIQQLSHTVHGPIKLGKLPPRLDKRTLKFSDYRIAAKITVPSEVSWVTKVTSWPMYLNDALGDCVPAAAAHMIQQWNFYAGRPRVKPTDADVLKAYQDVGGYVPGDPSTDNGANMLDMLKYWRTTGIGKHKILAFVALDPTKPQELFESILFFGNAYLGVQLPLSVQDASVWTVPTGGPNGDGTPGSLGGHCIPAMAASQKSRTVITWAAKYKMSPNFGFDYCDEAYGVISSDWLDARGKSPSGFDLAGLMVDLKQVTA